MNSSLYYVFDPEEYQEFSSYSKALKCAKSDVGEDGWVPCQQLVVVQVLAEVTVGKRSEPVVKEFIRR